VPTYTIDIELTNRCNADCYFCPRDATPHQGLMSEETFEQALRRAAQIRDYNTSRDASVDTRISFCGLGEPLLHKQAPDFVARAVEEGFTTAMSSNASLLDERRATALLDAGLSTIYVNVGERDDDYVDIYKLPFEKTRDNLVRFAEQAGDRCTVVVVLVDHRRDKAHVEAMERYWREQGLTDFLSFDIMNRGGALFVDHMQYESRPELATARAMIAARQGVPLCDVPFLSTFVGYDGNIYLCCSDWKKEAVVATVFDDALDYVGPKYDFVSSREPVCKTCNLDPLNALVDELQATEDGLADAKDPDRLADYLAGQGAAVETNLASVLADRPSTHTRRLIPVRSV
jgi:MoaA/NifB/PqqE/SkfB family radical SAM enzyme